MCGDFIVFFFGDLHNTIMEYEEETQRKFVRKMQKLVADKKLVKFFEKFGHIPHKKTLCL